MTYSMEDTKRQRLRHWLPEQINSRRFAGLEWIDERKLIFKVPWRHGSRHGWKLENDAAIFRKWAIHTGKYKPGQKADPRKWKTNFRCALNALPDINELKEQSNPRGKNAFKVYQITPGRKSLPGKAPKRLFTDRMQGRFPAEDSKKLRQASYTFAESKVVPQPSNHGVDILDIVIDMMDEYGSNNGSASPDSVVDSRHSFPTGDHGYYQFNSMYQAHM